MLALHCPHCQAGNTRTAHYCAACGQSLVVARLGSLGTGVLPKGYCFELRPLTLSVGRLPDNDLVIPTNLVAARHLRLHYEQGEFHAEDLAGYGDCRLNEQPLTGRTVLREGDTLELAAERLRFRRQGPAQPAANPGATAELNELLQLLLTVSVECQAAQSLAEVMDNALAALLHLSRTQRAWAWLLNETEAGPPALHLLAARYANGQAILASEAPPVMPASLWTRLRQAPSAVIIEEGGRQSTLTPGRAAQAGASWLALPLPAFHPARGRRSVRALLYAETPAPGGALPSASRAAAQMLAELVGSSLGRWQSQAADEVNRRALERHLPQVLHELSQARLALAAGAPPATLAPALAQLDTELRQWRAALLGQPPAPPAP